MTEGPVGRLASSYIDRFAELDPCAATGLGMAEHDHRLPDFSPDGVEARADLYRSTLKGLAEIDTAADERLAAELMAERLGTELALVESGEPLRDLNVLFSPMQRVRAVFDLMPTAEPDHWATIAERMAAIPAALAGIRSGLDEGVANGMVAARRQVAACADQADAFGGRTGPSWFDGYLGRAPAAASAHEAALSEAAGQAAAAYLEMADWLRDHYAPVADPVDGVGAERYATLVPRYLGATIDLEDTYRWGWDQLALIGAELVAVADEISSGASPVEVRDLLETDPDRAIRGGDAFIAWVQDLFDKAIDALDGTHFDIDPRVRACEAHPAAEGSAAAPYYTRPSEDLSRPGRVWYPLRGRETFATWSEHTTAYHEAVPGHHLQLSRMAADPTLNRFQRITGVAGNAEGWALYAERLMDELGLMGGPDARFGMLAAQALRAARVVIDIGLHLDLDIPDDVAFHPGERWTPELSVEMLHDVALQDLETSRSETDRYLGLPGQAISYKVGERVWLDLRDSERRRLGDGFDLKEFHNRSLAVGCVGLDLLRREVAS